MEIFAAISAFIGITTLLYNIAKGIDDSQEAQLQSDKQEDLAKKQLAQNEKIAGQNFDLSKEQFEYQKQLNELTMQREDTAFQRQVADLKAAGLSPLNIAGGSPASVLTAANAPQFDISGINEAFKGLIGSYNDAFNRKLQSRQFALQNRVSTAQIYTQLAETLRDQKQAQLEYKYLDEKLKWEKTHGFRDLNWKSELTNVIEDILNGNKSSVLPGINNQVPDSNDIKTNFDNIISDIKTEKSRNNKSTAVQRSRDTSQLNAKLRADYKKNMDLLVSGTLDYDKFQKAAKYIYRYTDAWRDYETFDQFETALRSRSFRESLYEKYPFKSR